ncbi:MAG: hypothetical protein IPJ26_06725 [Bacteroidetes bacterium]|nr:hypothetical protein [Bacteroidota bacterium]
MILLIILFQKEKGFLSNRISKQAPFDINYAIAKAVSLGPLPTIEAMVMGANANAHPYQLKSAGNVLIDTLFYGYELVKHNFDITNLPSSGNFTFQFMPMNDVTFPGNLNYMQIAYAKLRYSRSFDFNGETLPLKLMVNSASAKALLECVNLNAAAPRMYVMSGDTIKLLIPSQVGGVYKGLVPMNGQEQSCYLLDNSQVFSFSGNATMKSVNVDTDPAKFARFNNFKLTGANSDFFIGLQ